MSTDFRSVSRYVVLCCDVMKEWMDDPLVYYRGAVDNASRSMNYFIIIHSQKQVEMSGGCFSKRNYFFTLAC